MGIAGDDQLLGQRELDTARHRVIRLRDHPHRLEPLQRKRCERARRLGERHVEVEQEELDQRRERATAREHAHVERKLGRVAPRGGLRRERLPHRRGGEAGLGEHRAQQGDPLEVVDAQTVVAQLDHARSAGSEGTGPEASMSSARSVKRKWNGTVTDA